MSGAPRRHFSMLRGFHLADFLTLGNAACGVGGVLLAMLYMASQSNVHFFWAAVFAPAAFAFDVLDGRVARARHQHSALGRELDSLADEHLTWSARPGAAGTRRRKAGHGVSLADKVVWLADLESGARAGRTSDAQITYSERGNLQGAQFHAVAAKIFEGARALGLGREIPTEWFLQDIRN